MQGQTIINRQTGERMVLQGGQWVPVGAASLTPAPTPAPSYVVPPNPVRVAERDAENARKAAEEQRARAAERRDQIRFAAEFNPDGTPRPKPDQKADEEKRQRVGSLNALVGQINRTQELFKKGAGATGGLAGVVDYLPTDANAALDAAGASLSQQGLAVFRVPGTGTVSDRDAIMFDRANLPQSSTRDAAVREQLRGLRARVEEEYRTLGLPLPSWQHIEAGTSDPQGDEANEPPPLEVYVEGGPNAGGPGAEQREREALDRLTPQERAEVQRRLRETNVVESGIAGATDTAGLGFTDEAGAVFDAAFGSGSGSFGDRFDSALRVNRAYMDGLRERDPKTYLTGQVIGGVALPGAAGTSVSRLAIAGGVQGGLYGVGSGEGVSDRITGGMTGAAVGSGVGALAGRAIPALSSRLTRTREPTTAEQLMQAAQRLDVQPMRADVGGPATRLATSSAAQSVLSAGPVVRAAQRAQEGMANARGRIASEAGDVLPLDEAGMVVRQGAERFTRETSARGGRLYDRAHEAASGVRVKPLEAMSVIDNNLAELTQAGDMAGPIVADLQKIKRTLEQTGGVTPRGIRTIRTTLADMVRRDGLRGTDTERRMRQVVDALSSDMERGLVQAGRKDAAQMFRRADAFWRERVEHIDQVLEPIVGRGKSGEDIIKAVEAMGSGNRGGSARLSRLMASLSDEEASSVRATLIDRLGRAARDAGDNENFSAARLVTQWDSLSRKGKQALFGNSETRRALDDLAFVAREMKASAQYANHSNTGGVLVNSGTFGTAGVMVAYGQIVPAAIGAALTHLTGRFLGSPVGAKWASRLARTSPTAPRRSVEIQISALSRIAQREPAIAQEALGLQRLLTDAIAQSPGRAAAQQEGNGRQEPPRQ